MPNIYCKEIFFIIPYCNGIISHLQQFVQPGISFINFLPFFVRTFLLNTFWSLSSPRKYLATSAPFNMLILLSICRKKQTVIVCQIIFFNCLREGSMHNPYRDSGACARLTVDTLIIAYVDWAVNIRVSSFVNFLLTQIWIVYLSITFICFCIFSIIPRLIRNCEREMNSSQKTALCDF